MYEVRRFLVRRVHNNMMIPTPSNPDAGFPNASNTGVPEGTVLTDYGGPFTISTNGTTLENRRITGEMLSLTGDNITIRNCEVIDGWPFGIRGADGGANLTIENCTVTGGGTGNAGIASRGIIRNNKISRYENGIIVETGATTVTGNYIFDLEADVDGHPDGIAMHGGHDGVLVENNTIYAYGTSAVFLKADPTPSNNVTINRNLCRRKPGESYSYAIYDDGTAAANTNVTITNNVLEEGFFGYITLSNSTAVVSGNIDVFTREPVGA